MPVVTVADPGAISASRRIPLHVFVACVGLVGVGSSFPLPFGRLSLALAVGLALAPVAVPVAVRRTRWSSWFLVLSVVAVACGLWLSARPGGPLVDAGKAREEVLLLLSLSLGVCVVVWARTVMPDHLVALVYGLGLLLHLLSTYSDWNGNPWKFGFALPVAVLSLSLLWRWGSWRSSTVVLVLLAAASGLSDSRSAFALLLLAALLLVASHRPRAARDRRRWVGALCLLAVALLAAYQGVQTLILDGYLGEATQQRSQAQVEASGSLLLGSRPEAGATLSLMRHYPAGFGVGAQPRSAEIYAAKTGMSSIGYQPDNGYVEKYMFGSGFELHSVVGDLWALFGIGGLALGVAIGAFTVSALGRGLTEATVQALPLYLGLRVMRDLAFSPLQTSIPVAVLFIGLAVHVYGLTGSRTDESLASSARWWS